VVVLVAASCLATLAGCIFGGSSKFIRLTPEPGCSTSWVDLADATATPLCCPVQGGGALLCQSLSLRAVGLLTTIAGAWVVPLVPVLVSLISWRERQAALHRLGHYIVLLAFRTFVLYAIVDRAEALLQPPETSACPYAHLRRSGLCKENWDGADHITLFVVHHLAVAVFEAHAVLVQRTSPSVLQAASLALSALTGCLACLGIAQTTAFFHSLSESLFGLLLGLGGVLVWEKLVIRRQQLTPTAAPS